MAVAGNYEYQLTAKNLTDKAFAQAQANMREFERAGSSALASFSSNAKKYFNSAGDASKKFAQTLAVASAAVGVGLSASVKEFANFEKQMSKVNAVANPTAEQFAEMTELAKEMGRTTAFTAKEAADGLVFLGMAGFNAEESMQSLEGTLKLAAAAGIDLGSSADIASNVLTGFQLATTETDRVVDVLAATITSSNTDLLQMSDAMKYFAPTAAAFGISLEESSAAIGLMGNAGIQGSLATRALGTSLTRLTGSNKKAADAMAEWNIEAFNAQGEFIGIAGLVEEMEVAFEGATDAQKQQAISTIFGAEAIQEINVLLAAGSDELRAYTAELENSAGAADEMARKQLDNLAGSFTLLKSAVSGFMIDLGERLAPILREVTDNFTALVNEMTNVIPTLDEMVKWARDNQEMLKGLAGAIAGALLPAIASMAIAISGVVLTLAPFAAAGYLIAKNWDTVSPVLKRVAEFIKEFRVEIEAAVKALALLYAANKVRTIFSGIGSAAAGAAGDIGLMTTATKGATTSAGGLFASLNPVTIAIGAVAAGFYGAAKANGELQERMNATAQMAYDSITAFNVQSEAIRNSISAVQDVTQSYGTLQSLNPFNDFEKRFISSIRDVEATIREEFYALGATQAEVNAIYEAASSEIGVITEENYGEWVALLNKELGDAQNTMRELGSALTGDIDGFVAEYRRSAEELGDVEMGQYLWDSIQDAINKGQAGYRELQGMTENEQRKLLQIQAIAAIESGDNARGIGLAIATGLSDAQINNAIRTSGQEITDEMIRALDQVDIGVGDKLRSLKDANEKRVQDAQGKMKDAFVAGGTVLAGAARGAIQQASDAAEGKSTEMSNAAPKWAGNFVTMFAGGLTNNKGLVASAAAGLMATLKANIGFSSPTEEGPASNSDEWAPNFVNMFADGIADGEGAVRAAAEQMVGGLEAAEEAYRDWSSTQVDGMSSLIRSYEDLAQDHARAMERMYEDRKSTTEKLATLSDPFSEFNTSYYSRAAKEVVGMEERAAELRTSIASDMSDERVAAMKQELADIEASLSKNGAFISSISTQVERERQLSSMDSLSRIVFLHQEETNNLKAQYNEQLAALNTKIASEQQAYMRSEQQFKSAMDQILKTDFDGKDAMVYKMNQVVDEQRKKLQELKGEFDNLYNTTEQQGGSGKSTSSKPRGAGIFAAVAKNNRFADGGLGNFGFGAGIKNQPVLGLAGESGTEAVVPLPDGRSIPVTMTGGGGGQIINNYITVQGSVLRESDLAQIVNQENARSLNLMGQRG